MQGPVDAPHRRWYHSGASSEPSSGTDHRLHSTEERRMTEAIREIYWNVGEGPGSLSLYICALVALAVMTWGILRDIARWRRGKADARMVQIPARLIESLAQVFGQNRVMRDRKPGSMHALIFFGFLALFIGTDILAVEE